TRRSSDLEGEQCAVVTRNDNTRSSDRSQDVFVPVTFAGQDDTGSGSGSGDGAGDGQTVGTTNNGGTPAAGGGGTSSGGKDGTLQATGSEFGPFVLGALSVDLPGGG